MLSVIEKRSFLFNKKKKKLSFCFLVVDCKCYVFKLYLKKEKEKLADDVHQQNNKKLCKTVSINSKMYFIKYGREFFEVSITNWFKKYNFGCSVHCPDPIISVLIFFKPFFVIRWRSLFFAPHKIIWDFKHFTADNNIKIDP